MEETVSKILSVVANIWKMQSRTAYKVWSSTWGFRRGDLNEFFA
jgi:hypothetical protein